MPRDSSRGRGRVRDLYPHGYGQREANGELPFDCGLEADLGEYEASLKRLAAEPESWRAAARALARHAELASLAIDDRLGSGEECADIARVNLMQWGQAIEAALKAALIAQGKDLESVVGFSHDLPGLAEQAGLPASDAEMAFLGELSEAIVWAGKYPAPRGVKGLVRLQAFKAFARRAGLAEFMESAETHDARGRSLAALLFERTQALSFSLPDMVTAMRDSGFPAKAIAEIARVDRKTVYSWLDGEGPLCEQHQDRVRTLYGLLRKATDGHFRPIHRVWNAKWDDGVTLRDLLTAESLDAVAIQAKLTGMARSIERYTRMDLNPVPNPPVSDGNPALEGLPVADLI
jgi:hypothetical protein